MKVPTAAIFEMLGVPGAQQDELFALWESNVRLSSDERLPPHVRECMLGEHLYPLVEGHCQPHHMALAGKITGMCLAQGARDRKARRRQTRATIQAERQEELDLIEAARQESEKQHGGMLPIARS